MLGVVQLRPRWVFVLALMIGVAGCSGNPTRFKDDRRAGQGASVAPTTKLSRLHRKPVAEIDKAKYRKLLNHSTNSVKPTGEVTHRKGEDAWRATEEAIALPVFHWPVQGRVIASFGSLLNGGRNDGINLAVPEGTPVEAAESGIVSYAGDGFQGEGNLVLIRHSNGYFTIYAHSKELLVNRGDEVKRGQIIALSGQTGNVNAPQLHFEVRKGGTPLDPMRFLKS
jgi:murein DD-endopeptidase MepM/ murein hydrolase activator NlpD